MQRSIARSAPPLACAVGLAALAGCGFGAKATYTLPVPLVPVVGCAPREPVAPVSSGPAALWAAPAGQGGLCTATEPCGLGTALTRLRPLLAGMNGDVRLLLLGGTYSLDAPLELCEDGEAHDSGTNGFSLVIEAAPGAHPILSGGRRIGPWEEVPGRTGVFRAAATGLRTRQLYVNGVRATRARSAPGPTYDKTARGFVRHDTAMLGWPDAAGVEVVGRGQWRTTRCPVASVAPTAGGTSLVLAEPCWTSSQAPGEERLDAVSWIENALELLDEPGEWFLDEEAGAIYYAPRPGESLDTAEVVAPVLETLLRASGGVDAAGAPVFLHDVVLRGIGFEYATWLAPSEAQGYAEFQAGFHRVALDRIARTPGAVVLARTQGVRVERCTFAHLGGAGLSIEAGSKDAAAVGNAFADLSSSAVEAGDVGFADTADDAWRTRGVTISNNLVRRAGVEYEGAVGVFLGHSDGGRIEHNDVGDLPYTGISVGWGWGYDASSYARDNRISGNHVHDVMTVHRDGGALYTLGPQPGSLVADNLLERVGAIALYHDEGSAFFTTTRNVMDGYVYWLSLWTWSIHDNVVTGNYATVDHAYCFGHPVGSASCNRAGNVVDGNVFSDAWPETALGVRAAAGLEPSYQDLVVP